MLGGSGEAGGRCPARAGGDGPPGHLLDAVGAVVLIVHVARHVFEVVHVSANEHVAQFHKIAVRLVLHCGRSRRTLSRRRASGASHPSPSAACLISPSTIPQGYSRPRTRCPLASTTVLLPITAKGALSWGRGARTQPILVCMSSWLRGGGHSGAAAPRPRPWHSPSSGVFATHESHKACTARSLGASATLCTSLALDASRSSLHGSSQNQEHAYCPKALVPGLAFGHNLSGLWTIQSLHPP